MHVILFMSLSLSPHLSLPLWLFVSLFLCCKPQIMLLYTQVNNFVAGSSQPERISPVSEKGSEILGKVLLAQNFFCLWNHHPYTDISDLVVVHERIYDLTTAQYTRLGLQLGLLLPTLNNIKEACHADEYGINVLQAWLEQKDLVEGKGGPT